MLLAIRMLQRQPFPFKPMLCEIAEHSPAGHDWRYELKLDGFCAIGRKSGRSAQLWSRNQKDFTRRFPGLVKGIADLPSDTVIDGEIVALDEHGKPSFNLVQGFGSAKAIVFDAFDLLMPQGKERGRLWPLDDRREQLSEIVATLPDTIRYSETFNVPLAELMRAVKKGISSKASCAGSGCWPGERSADWVKWRADRGQEFVIGGYIPNECKLDDLDVFERGRAKKGQIHIPIIRAPTPSARVASQATAAEKVV